VFVIADRNRVASASQYCVDRLDVDPVGRIGQIEAEQQRQIGERECAIIVSHAGLLPETYDPPAVGPDDVMAREDSTLRLFSTGRVEFSRSDFFRAVD
jgi:hypothetical protein